MDFNFTDDQNMIFNEVKKMSTSKLNENIFKDDENSRFPIEKWKLCGDFGILGLPVQQRRASCLPRPWSGPSHTRLAGQPGSRVLGSRTYQRCGKGADWHPDNGTPRAVDRPT